MTNQPNIKVNGKYMGQDYTGFISEVTYTQSCDVIFMAIKLDAPINVFARGQINRLDLTYRDGNLDGVCKVTVNAVS